MKMLAMISGDLAVLLIQLRASCFGRSVSQGLGLLFLGTDWSLSDNLRVEDALGLMDCTSPSQHGGVCWSLCLLTLSDTD